MICKLQMKKLGEKVTLFQIYPQGISHSQLLLHEEKPACNFINR